MKNTKLVTRIICIVMAVILVLSLIVSVIPAFASADDDYETQLAALKAQKEEAQTRRNTASNKLAALKEEKETVVEEKLVLEERNAAATEEITIISEQIDLINAEIEDYNNKIALKEQDVVAAQQNEDDQLGKYRTRIRAMEENGTYNILALILNADSFSSLLAAADDYGDVMNSDKQLYDNLQAAREEHQRIKAEYEAYKAECEEKKAAAEADKEALEAEKAALETQIAESEAELENLAELIKQAEEEQAAAEAALASTSASISSFMAEYEAQKAAAQAAAVTTTVDPETGETVTTTTAASSYDYSVSGSGAWVWPFPSSYRISSTMKPRWGKTHTGVDIDGYGLDGSAIVAADAGTVIKAEWYGGYGNCVIIDHNNGYQTLYGHLSSISVSNGSAVSAGQTVGGVGATGTATGTHLHFEMFVNGSRVNPLDYYSGWVLEDGAGDPS